MKRKKHSLKTKLILGLIFLFFFGLFAYFSTFKLGIRKTKANFEEEDFEEESENPQFLTIQSNSLLAISEPASTQARVIRKINVVVTGYSSSYLETDDTPFLTANGKIVEEGIVANNLLPFGTKIRLPEIYGEKIFVVEDRMHWSKSKYYVDVWFPSRQEALNFGAKRTFIEVLEG